MSIQIEASYSKKLGLPNFSSHSFMVTVRGEISSLRRLETESTRLYRVLQTSVDKEVQQVGFLPAATYGMIVDAAALPNGTSPNCHEPAPVASDTSRCSEKQTALILKVAKEQKFTPADLDGIARRLFKLPLPQLDKKQTSGFISELLAIAGPPRFRRPSKGLCQARDHSLIGHLSSGTLLLAAHQSLACVRPFP